MNNTIPTLIKLTSLILLINCNQIIASINSHKKSKETHKDNTQELVKKWGQYTKEVKVYRGKAGLINLTLQSSGNFIAFRSTDYLPYSTEQTGSWNIKDLIITFTVLKTKGKAFKTVLIENKKGTVQFKVIELSKNNLVLKNLQNSKTIKLKPTKF
jgi:hypothetical protein